MYCCHNIAFNTLLQIERMIEIAHFNIPQTSFGK